MSTLWKTALAVSVILFALSTLSGAAQTTSAPPSALDATLFTTYSLSSGDQNVSLSVCGSLPGSEGCYGGAFLGPFGKIGALLEGNPSTKGNTVIRAIYVLDIATGTTGADVSLSIYKKTDTISSSFDTVAVTLLRTISLPLTGGSTAVCSMAANAGYLFIGTNQSPQGVEVKKSTGVVTVLGGFSPPINVTSITADQYGYVTVTQGSFGGGENGFSVFGPTGGGEGGGGGADFMVGATNAVSTATLPTSDQFPFERLVVRPRASANPTRQ
jgi:hypothetical protein